MGGTGNVGRGPLRAVPFLIVLGLFLLPSCSLLGGSVGVNIDELKLRMDDADANKDGTLSILEMTVLFAALRAADADQDGTLTSDELRAAPVARTASAMHQAMSVSGVPLAVMVTAPRPPLSDAAKKAIRAADTNKDGALSPAERDALLSRIREEPATAPPTGR